MEESCNVSTKLTIGRWWKSKVIEGADLVYEGDLPMSKEEKSALEQLLGDPKHPASGKACVTVGRTITETVYGRGGSTFVNVSLICKQHGAFVDSAIEYAQQVIENHLGPAHEGTRDLLKAKGIMDPDGSIP